MNRMSKVCLYSLYIAASFLIIHPTGAATTPYTGEILFKQTNARIIERDNIRWAGVPDEDVKYLKFRTIMSSLDGSRLFFNVYCEFCDEAQSGYKNRPFVANGMGKNIQDISSIFPTDLTSSAYGWGNMRINDDGSKVFIAAQRDVGNERLDTVYYMELPSGNTGKAVFDDFVANLFDWFTIDKKGDRLYLGKYDEGYDDSLKRNRSGLYYADLDLSRNWYLDILNLPCTYQCSNLAMMDYMGSSLTGDHTFFTWNAGQAMNICTGDECNHKALWHITLGGSATLLTSDEHYWVSLNKPHGSPHGWRGISTEAGETVLYAYIHREGDPLELNAVDRATQAETLLTWTTDVNGYDEYFITPSGRFVFVRGGMGSFGGHHYHTLFDQQQDSTRDSWSYFLPRVYSMSNLVQDRYYFVTYDDSVYRIDTQANTAGDFSQAPNISRIAFSGPVVWDNDATQLTVTANVSDMQGRENIDKVLLTVLIEGMEDTYWFMPREPLAFPTQDPGDTLLYDDGTHGDLTAGDGVFTFDGIATRKGDREGPDAWNTWYQHYTLPNDVGIRVIAFDKDGNSTIADTALTIAGCELATKTFSTDISGKELVCTTDRIELAGLSVKKGAEVHLNAPNVTFGLNTHVEKGALLTVGTE